MSLKELDFGALCFIQLCLLHDEMSFYHCAENVPDHFWLYLETPEGQIRQLLHNDYEVHIEHRITYLDEERWDRHTPDMAKNRLDKWISLY